MQGKCAVIGGLLLAMGIASAQVSRTRDNPADLTEGGTQIGTETSSLQGVAAPRLAIS